MSKYLPNDLTLTLQVLEGKRRAIENDENGKTWLRHSIQEKGRIKGQCGKIDLKLLEGASKSEIAAFAKCTEERVEDHFIHLQEFWNGPMEPHHLRLKKVNGKWYFDEDWIRQQVLQKPSNA